MPHVPRARVSRHEVVHVTLRCVDRLPSLRRPTAASLVERVFAEEGARKGFRLVHYAIRSNHLHLVCEADDTRALSRGVQRVAGRIARQLNARFARGGRFFADRFHGRVIRAPRDLRNALRYVLLNEHKDQARRGRTVKGYDPYSSWKWFDGWADQAVAPRPPPPLGAPVAAPASWLMRVGWRRHGSIRTSEMAPRERR